MSKLTFGGQLVLSLGLVAGFLMILQGVLDTIRPAQQPAVYPTQVCTAPVATLNAVWVAEGSTLYAAHCAACHGTQLEGASGWETPLADGANLPPPLDSTGHAMLHSDDALFHTIKNGLHLENSVHMPAFENTLSSPQIWSVIEYIKSTWTADSFYSQHDMAE